MKEIINDGKFNTRLTVSDWRFSASVIGLIRYFRYHNIEFEIEDDSILYNSDEITEEKYFKFAEYYFYNDLHHTVIEDILQNNEFSEEQVKLVNQKLKAAAIMKDIFKDIKFTGSNKEEIIELINNNRLEIIKETFRRKSEMYRTFCNENKLLTQQESQCRLAGFFVDKAKKINSVSYKFNKNTHRSTDCIEFDFIVFGFSRTREHIFINDNFNIKRLQQTQDYFQRTLSESNIKDSYNVLFQNIIQSINFINRDVEIIVKSENKKYYETMFVRKSAINILKQIASKNIDYKALYSHIKVTDKYYININREVMHHILNNIAMDSLIEKCIKYNKRYIVNQLTKINNLIKKDGDEMDSKMKNAYACAMEINKKLEKNKVESYKNKLLGSIMFKDYDRVCTILMKLSMYSKVQFSFAYSLFDNFEDNKNIIYTFINTLGLN